MSTIPDQEPAPVNQKPNVDKYQSALELLFYEGQIAWQMNLLFIGLNVGIGTIIATPLLQMNKYDWFLGVFALIGLLVNIAWLGTFKRNNKYYHFRMAQAREAEPKDWQLLSIRGYKFSKGQEIIIKGKGIENKDVHHKLSWFENKLSNKYSIQLAIWIAIFSFSILLVLSVSHLVKQSTNRVTVKKTISYIQSHQEVSQ